MTLQKPFLLLLVKEQEDFLIVKSDACLKCTEKKTGHIILKSYQITEREFLNAKTNRMGGWIPRSYNVKCECEQKDNKLSNEVNPKI